jgi:hypothetical protein
MEKKQVPFGIRGFLIFFSCENLQRGPVSFFLPLTYVTRVRVRVSDTILIGYADTHFLKRKPIKMVYPSIRICVSGEYQIRIRHPL